MRFPWNRIDRELEREVAHHLHHLAAEYQGQGYSREEARQMARRTFGGPEQVKEQCRSESRWSGLLSVLQDVTFGTRMMRRTPVITLAAVLSLALGIGANTAIVSLMDVVMWRDLPLPSPQQLSLVYWQGQGFPRELADGASGSMSDEEGGIRVADFFSYPSFEMMRDGVVKQASVAAFGFPDMVSVSFAGRAMVARQRPVSGNFFSTLQAQAELGRLFTDADDRKSTAAIAVLSHHFWANSLGSDPSVIGRTITLNGQPQIIAGVLSKSFYGLNPGDSAELYTTLHHAPKPERAPRAADLTNNRFWICQLIARRAPGVTNNQLQPAMDVLFHASWAARPKNPTTAPRIRLEDGSRGLGFLRKEFRNPLLVLGGLVGLLLVIACTNIVNLLLARAVARQREVGVRISLGCSRQRLIRQFVTESAMLAGLAGLLSIGIGLATAKLLGQFLAERDGPPLSVTLDWRVLLTVALISFTALLLFGIFPALQGSRFQKTNVNRPGLGGLGVGEHRWSVGRTLVVAQVGMSVVLVIAAVLFTRNLLAFESADPGFDRRNLVMFAIRPGTSGYEKGRLPSFYLSVEQRLAATPGVTGVGMASIRPMNVGGRWETVQLPGQQAIGNASINGVTPNYLPTLGSRLVAGRGITQSDLDTGAKVAIISQDLAEKFGKEKALGKILQFADGPPGKQPEQFQIIGIAPAVTATSMKERPFTVWLPIDPEGTEVTVLVRTSRAPQQVLPAVKQTMHEFDPNLPLVEVATMEEQIAKGLQRERMFATLCTAFGVLALVLSTVGLYGVVSYSTSRRRGEIGVRLALGAMPRDVLSMVLREGLWLAALGTVIAVPVVWFGTRYLDKLLAGMKPLEPASIVLALAFLWIAALIAIGVPALRASSLDPAETLRQE